MKLLDIFCYLKHDTTNIENLWFAGVIYHYNVADHDIKGKDIMRIFLIAFLCLSFSLTGCSHVADGMRSMADGFDSMGKSMHSDEAEWNGMEYDERYADYYSQEEYNTYMQTLQDANGLGVHDAVAPGVATPPLRPAPVPYRVERNGMPARINQNVTVYSPDAQMAQAAPSMMHHSAPQPQQAMYPSVYAGPSLTASAPQPMPQAGQFVGGDVYSGQNGSYRVFFAEGSTKVSSRYKDVIKAVADAYKAHPVDSIVIEGHASKSGNPSINLKLSAERSVNVANALVKHGVPANVITTRSHGEAMPSSYVSGMDHEQASRRVEIFLDASSPVATGLVPPAPPVTSGHSASGVPLLFGN